MTTRKSIGEDKYILFIGVISFGISLLIHLPELISLFGHSDPENPFLDMEIIEVVSEIIFAFLSLIALFILNMLVFHFNNPTKKISRTQVFLSFLLTIILSTALSKLFVFLHNVLDLPAVESTVHHYLHPFRDFIIGCVVTSSSYIIYLINRQQYVQIENQQLQAQNILSQYEVLKNQLNPHMLFNSLNTLQSLTRENQEKAQEYIKELSRVLRYTLQDNESQCVMLQEEMQFISAYIFLLQMRYEDNLHFEIDVNRAFDSYRLPPMSLQILLENAVKHNEISNKRPLTVRIFTDDNESITVSNIKQPKLTATSGTGIGLMNLAKRYELIFNREINIIDEKEFTVSIPLIPNPL